MKIKISSLILEARKSKNPTHLMAYQYVMSAIQALEGRIGKSLSDEEILSVIEREVKSLKEMVEEKTAKNDETSMIEVLLKLLPARIEVSQYEGIVNTAIVAVGASGIKDMGKVMTNIRENYGSTVDGKIISPMVKDKLK